jgi:large subunit ribosomal protein L10
MRQEKQLLLDEVESQINKSGGSFVILKYLGLTANKANEFRGDIAKAGGTVEVVRKRLLVKAAQAAGIEIDLKALEGHIGLVFGGSDPLETNKLVFKFSEENGKTVNVIGGRFEGQLYNAAEMETLSKLPSKDEMRAQLLSVLQAPMSETLGVMDAVLSSVLYCLDNKCKQNGDVEN